MVLCEATCGAKMLILKSMTYSRFNLVLLAEISFTGEYKKSVEKV